MPLFFVCGKMRRRAINIERNITMAQAYFLAYFSYLDAIEPLDDAERGRLFTACLHYAKTGKAPILTGNERFVFGVCKSQIDRDKETHVRKCETNRKNGASAAERSQSLPNGGKTRKEKEKEKEKEREKEKENAKDVLPPPAPPQGELDACVREAFENYKKARLKLKKPMTEEAERLAVERLKSLSGDPKTQLAILNQSIERGWSGLFEIAPRQQPQPFRSIVPRALDYPQRTYTAEQLEHMGMNLLDDE